MADGIRGIPAVAEEVIESLVAGDGLILAESDEEIGEFVVRNAALANGFGERDEDGMTRRGFRGVGFSLALEFVFLMTEVIG